MNSLNLTHEEKQAVELHGDKFSIEHVKYPEQAIHYISGNSKRIQRQVVQNIPLTKEQYFFLQIATVIQPEFTLTMEQQKAFEEYEKEMKCNC